MKKFFKYSLIILSSVTILVSCEKIENTKENLSGQNPTTNNSVTKSTAGPGFGIHVTWDEWGRKSKSCYGCGLCNIRIVEPAAIIQPKTAPVLIDLNGNLYIEVLVDKDLKFENGTRSFYIDEDIYNKAPNGKTYKLSKGIYKINLKLGKLGGYRLPLIAV